MPLKFARSLNCLLCLSPLVIVPANGSFAQVAGQEGAKPVKPKRDKYGSPLDTLMTTHLWTVVPPTRDFVTQSRPDVKTLDYAPLTGVEPEPDRPKVRDAANISALRAELEGDAANNQRKARSLRPISKARPKQVNAPRS